MIYNISEKHLRQSNRLDLALTAHERSEIRMELIKITDQKLKIMLTPSDMTHYELDPKIIESLNAHTSSAFRSFWSEIRRQYNLDFDDSHLSVQYFPSRGGGCEMFVCSMQSPSTDDSKDRKKRGSTIGSTILPVDKTRSGHFLRETAYRFDSLAHLLAACHRLKSIGYIGESAAYRDGSSAYYLLLKLLSASPFSLPEEFSFLCEYGRPENAYSLRLYFREHGSVIRSPDAVDILAELL